MARKTLNWDDIYNYIQVAPKDKCIAMVELINRKYGWEDGLPEKTLDDFTMEEILKYAKAYLGNKIYNLKDENEKKPYKSSTNKFYNIRCGSFTKESLNEFIMSKKDINVDVIDQLCNSNDKSLRQVTRNLTLSQNIMSDLYNILNEEKYKEVLISHFYSWHYTAPLYQGLLKMQRENTLQPILNIVKDKSNKLNKFAAIKPHIYGVKENRSTFAYDRIFDILDAELRNKLRNAEKNEKITYVFTDNNSKGREPLLVELSKMFGHQNIIKLLNNVGFENINTSTLHNPSFLCNLSVEVIMNTTKMPGSILELPVTTRIINEVEEFWIQGKYKIFDIYGVFLTELTKLINTFDGRYDGSVMECLVHTGLFGTIDPRLSNMTSLLRDRLAKSTSEMVEKIISRNRSITIYENSRERVAALKSTISLHKLKWTYIPLYDKAAKNPQTVVYYLLKVGVTNKEIQKLAECTSLEVLHAAKDFNVWVNNIDGWRKGALKDLCEVCIKKGIHYNRLAEILITVPKSRIYSTYYQLIHDNQHLIDHLR